MPRLSKLSKIVIKFFYQKFSSKFVIKHCHQCLKGLWGRSLMSKIKSGSVSEWVTSSPIELSQPQAGQLKTKNMEIIKSNETFEKYFMWEVGWCFARGKGCKFWHHLESSSLTPAWDHHLENRKTRPTISLDLFNNVMQTSS